MQPTLPRPADDAPACALGPDPAAVQAQVLRVYDRVARDPAAGFHFHVGADHAVQRLGYDAAALARLPARATARFAGVGHPFAAGRVPEGATVLDHACGAGTDLLLAALQAGPGGRAIGVDLTPAMREVASAAAAEAGLADRVQVLAGSFDDLPLADASVDVVLSNGVLNLAPDKPHVLREALRVLRPGGRLLLADVVLRRPLHEAARAQPALWAACVGGALTLDELLAAIGAAGFERLQVAAHHDCFGGAEVQFKLGDGLLAGAVTLSARRPR
ncbi:MAG: methyltransferase domain-containing protein [Rubrivivax sp.]|nr:methyltransferase domain-containing protein [Rubrivivax sp.]